MSNSNAQYIIREPTIDDVEVLAQIHLDTWRHTYRGILDDAYLANLNRETFEGYHRSRFDSVTGRVDVLQPFVAACAGDGEVVGFARGGPTRAHSPTGDRIDADLSAFTSELYAIYVSPAHQRRGVGGILFSSIASALHAQGHPSLCVWVLTANQSARAFYEHRGAEIVGNAEITLGGKTYPETGYGLRSLRSYELVMP